MTKNLTCGHNIPPESAGHDLDARAVGVFSLIADNLADIARRNDALLFRNLPPRTVAQLTEAVADVTRLNSISTSTNIDTFLYLDAPARSPVFARKVERLLTWAVTPLQFGDHRPYAAATLLQRWRERLGPRSRSNDQDILQDLLFEFLDANEPDGQSLPAITLLYGELVKGGLFSYELYVQRLIARGEPGLSFSDVRRSSSYGFFLCADHALVEFRLSTPRIPSVDTPRQVYKRHHPPTQSRAARRSSSRNSGGKQRARDET